MAMEPKPKLPGRRSRTSTTSPGEDGRAMLSNSNQFFALHEKFPDEPELKPGPPKKPPWGGPVTPGPTLGAPAPEPSPSPSTELNFHEYHPVGPSPPPGVVGGRAFFDANVNGLYDDGDNGVAEIVAWLFSCDGELVANARTSPEGLFQWENLPWGNYLVILQMPGGYVASTTVRSRDVYHPMEVAGSGGSVSNGRTICFTIREGGASHVELSFGMRLPPVRPPSPWPTAQPSGAPSRSPTPWPSRAPTPPPSGAPVDARAPFPPMRTSVPVPGEGASGGSSGGSATPLSPPPANDRPPPKNGRPLPWSSESSPSPTRQGENVGPIRSNGLRITLFGIEEVRDEEEMNDGMAQYINGYFNSGENYAFDVDVGIRITKQTAKLDSLGEYMSNYAVGRSGIRARRLQEQQSVELVYDQISTYRTIDPTFVDISYILQEPFATMESRYNYIAFLQRLSPDNFANVSSVSPVILPPRRESPTFEEVKISGSGLIVGLSIGVPLVLLLAMLFACIGRKKIPQGGKAPAPPETKREINEEMKESENKSESKSDSFSNLVQSATSLLQRSQEYLPWQPVAPSESSDVCTTGTTYLRKASDATWAMNSDATRSNSSEEAVIEISVPPGRVGCVIDSSPERGPYVCEVHEFSRIRDHVQTGDRIIAVDGENVEQLNAIAVSRMLGSRSENEERRVTLLRGFVPYEDTFDGSEPSDSDDGGDNKSLDIEDIGEEILYEERPREESSREEIT